MLRAGVGADGVLTAIVDWVRLKGPAARRARRLKQPVEESRVHVGGLNNGIHRSWLDRNVAVGDSARRSPIGKAGTVNRPRRQRGPSKPATREETTFLNVDLDIRSLSALDSLVTALGRSVFALHVGPDGRRHVARSGDRDPVGESQSIDSPIRRPRATLAAC